MKERYVNASYCYLNMYFLFHIPCIHVIVTPEWILEYWIWKPCNEHIYSEGVMILLNSPFFSCFILYISNKESGSSSTLWWMKYTSLYFLFNFSYLLDLLKPKLCYPRLHYCIYLSRNTQQHSSLKTKQNKPKQQQNPGKTQNWGYIPFCLLFVKNNHKYKIMLRWRMILPQKFLPNHLL